MSKNVGARELGRDRMDCRDGPLQGGKKEAYESRRVGNVGRVWGEVNIFLEKC